MVHLYKIQYMQPYTLDNLKNHTALLYITWGLIQDSKDRRKQSLRLTNFTGLSSGISKTREGISMQTSHKERKKILVVKFIVESASKNRKCESSNSSIIDELKFESSRIITSGMDKRNRIKLEDNMTN